MSIHESYPALWRGTVPRLDRTIVIAGGGVAGLRTAEALRHQGFTGPLIGFGAEPLPPYDRGQLSTVALRDIEWSPRPLPSSAQGFWWFLDMPAVGLDVAGKHITLDDGRRIDYDALVIATGRRAVTLPSAMPLRTLPDAHRLRSVLLTRTGHLAIVGAGLTGSEVAAAARAHGWHVTLIDAAPDPLAATLGTTPANWVWDQHRANGVDLRFGAAAVNGRVDLTDGTTIEADAVVTTLGTTPNTGWLAASGLDITDGVRTIETLHALTTTGEVADAIVAVGGVATTGSGSPTADARRAASALLGQPQPAETPHTFSTELYGHELRVIGRPGGARSTVEQGPAGFRVRYPDGDVIIDWPELMETAGGRSTCKEKR